MIPGLPYDHQLEYIECSENSVGNAAKRIVSLVCFDGRTDTIELECAFTSTRQYGTIIGCNERGISVGDGRFNVRRNGTSAYFNIQGPSFSSVPLVTGEWYHIQVAGQNNGGSFVNDVAGSFAQADAYVYTKPYFIFAGYDFSSPNWGGDAKIKYIRHRRNGVPIQDLIPVSVNGVAKMYDRVTGTFPRHYGTFVAGPVVSTPLMGLHMYGVSDYWFWPKKLVLMPSWNPSSITHPNVDPGLDVWAYRFADNGYAGGVAPDSALISFTSNSVTSENVSGYAEVLFRKFEPGSYKITANRDIPGAVRVLEYAPSGDGYIRSRSILTDISGGGTVAGRFVGKFDVASHTLTAFQFCSAQRGYQSVPGPCTFTDIHIYDYVQ